MTLKKYYLILILLFPILFYINNLNFYFISEHPLIMATYVDLTKHNFNSNKSIISLIGEWEISDKGLCLKGNDNGKIKIRWYKHPKTKHLAKFEFYPNINSNIQISLFKSTENTTETLSIKHKYNNGVVDFNWTNILKNENITDVTILIENQGSPSKNYPIIKSYSFISYEPAVLKILPWYVVLFFILIFYSWFSIRNLIKRNIIIVGWVFLFLLMVFFKIFPGASFISIYLYIFLSLIFSYIILSSKQEKEAANKIGFIIIGLILLVGFYLRWDSLIINEGIKLEYDAEDYFNIATKYSKGLFDTAAERPPYIREPLFIWIVKIFFVIFPKTPEALKTISMLLSILSIFSVYLFGKKYFGILPSIAACSIIAASKLFINHSVLGLREDLYIIVIIMFLYQVLKKESDFQHIIILGLISGAVLLVRLSSLSFIFPLVIIFSFINRWKILNTIIILFIAFMMILPHLIFNYKFQNSKDFLYSANIHTRYYRNVENAGKEGFITIEEFKKNPYSGEPISTFKFLVYEHSPYQLIKGMFRGGVRIFLTKFTYQSLFSKNNILLIIYILGMIALILSKYRYLYIIYFFLSFPVLYIASGIIVDRLILYIAPLQLLGMFAGWKRLAEYVELYYKK